MKITSRFRSENSNFEKHLGIQYNIDPVNSTKRDRRIVAGKILMKIAFKYLKPKQKKIFYSVWCKHGGDKKKGIMEYSRKTKEVYITNYINYNLAINSLRRILKKTRYYNILEEFIGEEQ